MMRLKFTPAAERSRRGCADVIVPGDAAVYRLEDGSHVWVSTSCILGEWETYAFPSTANGVVTSWHELEGSMRHDAHFPDPHAAVLARLKR